jgi:hypothetical protein
MPWLLLVTLHFASFLVTHGYFEYLWLRSMVNMSSNTFDILPECTKITNIIYSSLHTDIEKILLNATYNNRCAWLRTVKLDADTGIGHAASFLNANILLAMKYSLTLYTDFGPTGHGLSINEVDDLFNFGCVFGHSHVPPLSARYIPTTEKGLGVVYAANLHMLDCSKGHTVFDLVRYQNWGNRIRNGVVPQPNCNFFETANILGSIYHYSYPDEKAKKYLPTALREAKDRNSLIIGIHLRRGDILEQPKLLESRFISIYSVVEMLRQLLKAISVHRKEGRGLFRSRCIQVVFFTESAPNADTVIEYDETSKAIEHVNVTHLLQGICSTRNKCSVRVLMDVDADALQSFAAMCAVDVLLTAPSGFSHLAAVICRPTLILEVPFWCPYALRDSLNILQLPRSSRLELSLQLSTAEIANSFPLFYEKSAALFNYSS